MGSQKVDMNVVPLKIVLIFFLIFIVSCIDISISIKDIYKRIQEVAELWKINTKTYQYGYNGNEEGHPSNDISSVKLPDIEGRVRSLEKIFKSLHLSSNGCKNMLVCLLAKNQEKFSPMSQLVLDILKVDKTLVTQYELLYDFERRTHLNFSRNLSVRSKVMDNTVLYLNLLQGHCNSTVCDYNGEAMITEDRILAWKLNLMIII